jgi:hypothetical protein
VPQAMRTEPMRDNSTRPTTLFRRTALSLVAVFSSGCDNVVAKNFENALVWNGLDRELAHWVPPVVGVVGAYLAFRFLLGDTRK